METQRGYAAGKLALDACGKLALDACKIFNNADGLPGWSTEEKCRAFVDSEGGPERFAEILARGIL